jgi:hypothetical protein
LDVFVSGQDDVRLRNGEAAKARVRNAMEGAISCA